MSARIGITTSYANDEQCLRRDYVLAVERAGGCPVPLPMVDRRATVNALVNALDGLIVTGGPAVMDGIEGSRPDDLDAPDPVRSTSDRQYLDAALTREMPILGICYGMQLVNALAGGTIYADVERQVDGAHPHSQKRGASTHSVHLTDASRLRSILGTPTVTVNTRHIQAVARLGDGFVVAGRAPDGVIEAIEHETGRILGVQFHPERMGDEMLPLFQSFVLQASGRAPSSAPPASPAHS